jgi:hypothetical protein
MPIPFDKGYLPRKHVPANGFRCDFPFHRDNSPSKGLYNYMVNIIFRCQVCLNLMVNLGIPEMWGFLQQISDYELLNRTRLHEVIFNLEYTVTEMQLIWSLNCYDDVYFLLWTYAGKHSWREPTAIHVFVFSVKKLWGSEERILTLGRQISDCRVIWFGKLLMFISVTTTYSNRKGIISA